MVNETLDEGRAAERALALSYAPVDRRAALGALFDLDARLRAITLAARDPTIGLMRLTWWGEALAALDTAPAPAEPLLRVLSTEVLPLGVTGAMLAEMIDAWDVILGGQVEWGAVARSRGDTVFRFAAMVLVGRPGGPSGRLWAATDLVRDWPAAAGAVPPSSGWYRPPVPRRLRALGALGLQARFDAAGRFRPGDPRRVARLLWHRLTGR